MQQLYALLSVVKPAIAGPLVEIYAATAGLPIVLIAAVAVFLFY